VCPGDPDWPTALDVLVDVTDGEGQGGRPLALWVRGGALVDAGPAVAVVGSRAATDYGAWVAADLAADLAGLGVWVVSGGAYGIDGHAHRGALVAGGVTVAVLACGVDVAYPRQHEQLLERIAGDGGGVLVSEAPMGATARRNRFLVRNRLIAALSLGTVVVEAAARSGALNTANWADRCSRPTFAVPGPVGSALSAGTHRLVRERGAVLVTCAADVVEDLGLGAGPLGSHDHGQPTLLVDPVTELSADATKVLAVVPGKRSIDVAALSRGSGLAVPEVMAAVAELALTGLIDTDGSGYRRTTAGHAMTSLGLEGSPVA
jgi:DNA processing protein